MAKQDDTTEKGTPMTSETRKTIARFSGASVLALVVGLGAGAGGAIATAAITPASAVAPASSPAVTPAPGGITLTGCISNLNC
jgi:hypothetical protein